MRKSGAILAVVVLVLLSAPATGAAADSPDTAAGVGQPAANIRSTPVITSPKTGSFVNQRTVTFRGTTTGQVVQVRPVAHGPLLCTVPTPDPSWACTSAPLPDGTYSVYATAAPGLPAGSAVTTFTVDTAPPAPTRITAPSGPMVGAVMTSTTTNTRPVISGSGEAHASVSLFADGGAASCAAPIVVNATGAWSCQLTRPLTLGTHTFGSFQTDRAGNSSTNGTAPPQLRLTIAEANADVPVVVAPTPPATPPTPPQTPTTPPQPAPRGDTVPHSAAGAIHTGVRMPVADVPEDSAELPTLALPEDTGPSVGSGAVAAAPRHPKQSTGPKQSTPTDAGRNDPAAPSLLTNALSTVQMVFGSPVILGTAVGSGAALMLFVALPAELLNSTLGAEYERLFGRLRRIHLRWIEALRGWFARTPFAGGVALTAAAALIFGFADPHFGFDLTSLRLVLACAIALVIVGHVANLITGWIIQERWQVATVLEVKPMALVLTVVGVILSRMLGFSPGFLIGLIVGMSLTGSATARQRSRSVLLHGGVVLGFGVLAWLGYSALIAATGGEPATFWQALGLDTLAAVAAEGLTMLLIGLLPFRLLEGENVYAESKTLWAFSYLSVLVAFCVIVLPVAANWEEWGGSIWLWLSCVVGFALFSVAVYLYFRYVPFGRARKNTSESPEVSEDSPAPSLETR